MQGLWRPFNFNTPDDGHTCTGPRPSHLPDFVAGSTLQVKGAMKSGTTGRKMGPIKTLAGFHVDGSPLQLKVMLRAHGLADIISPRCSCGPRPVAHPQVPTGSHT